MKIPKGMTETEVLESIETVTKGLSHKFVFGFYDLEDIMQEARIEAFEALEDYVPEKGKLTTFLWTHVRNRLSNLKRNKFERKLDKPCVNCPLNAYDPHCARSTNQCTEYRDRMNCEPYANWFRRNSSKKNIMSPIEIDYVRDESEKGMRVDFDIAELVDLGDIMKILDEELPANLRKSWLKLKNGTKMPKGERTKLIDTIRSILREKGYDT